VGTAGAVSVRSDQELHPCWTGLVTASFTVDLPLTKAEPISSVYGTSVIACLIKDINYCTAVVRKRSVKNVRETTLHTQRSVKK